MGFAEDVINRVFGKSTAGKIMLDEGVIRRDDSFKSAYEHWLNGKAIDTQEELRRNLSLSNKGLHDDLRTIWLKMNHAQGFRIFLDELCSPEEDRFVLDFIKDSLIGAPYRLSNSFFKYEDDNNRLQEEEWYYLKPPLSVSTDGSPMNQYYGNIKIELHRTDRRSIKLLATTYSGRMYSEAKPFQELLELMFGPFAA